MDFFASQDAAHRKTGLLLLYFALAVIFIIVAIYLAFIFIFLYQQNGTGQLAVQRFWNPDLFFTCVVGTLGVVGLGSLYKISVLRSGGVRVAEMLGGRLIPAGSNDFLEKRLLNVVEEMAIASGVPVPPVYLMENEKGINAFAAGFTKDDAVIGITRGALDTLNREELQGVVAHEFSHILNGDMWLDLKLVGFLHGILLIALIGRSILRGSSRSRNSKNSGGAVLFGLILLILGYIGVLFGRLIKSSVSRQREYLADASAVQFTRNPNGLAGALKKIGGLSAGSLIVNNRAEEISHMFFSNGLKSSGLEFFSTHPPLLERILRLDPAFDGVFPKVIEKQEQLPDIERPAAKRNGAQGLTQAGTAAIALSVLAAAPENITRDIGLPVREHMDYARRLLDSLPEQIHTAAHDPFGARAVIYGLILDRDMEVRQLQLNHLKTSADREVYEATEKIAPLMLDLAEESRLPLMDLAMPSLRSLSLKQFRTFEQNINRLVMADKRVSLFEFVLEYVVVKRLEKNYTTSQGNVKEIRSLQEAANEISCTLSFLANRGHEHKEAAEAFQAAAATLDHRGDVLKYLTPEDCRKTKLADVLNRLAQLNQKIKKTLIAACFQCLVYDKKITMQEAEFFRLLVYALDVPLPPWVKI
jgi:Zn-dependent protease with chaperone function